MLCSRLLHKIGGPVSACAVDQVCATPNNHHDYPVCLTLNGIKNICRYPSCGIPSGRVGMIQLDFGTIPRNAIIAEIGVLLNHPPQLAVGRPYSPSSSSFTSGSGCQRRSRMYQTCVWCYNHCRGIGMVMDWQIETNSRVT